MNKKKRKYIKQIKSFQEPYNSTLTREVNDFIKEFENPDDIIDIDFVCMAETQYSTQKFTAFVTYKKYI